MINTFKKWYCKIVYSTVMNIKTSEGGEGRGREREREREKWCSSELEIE